MGGKKPQVKKDSQVGRSTLILKGKNKQQMNTNAKTKIRICTTVQATEKPVWENGQEKKPMGK